MRRTMFAKASGSRDFMRLHRASAREALSFDVRDIPNSAELSLAERRAGSGRSRRGCCLPVTSDRSASSCAARSRSRTSARSLASACIPLLLALVPRLSCAGAGDPAVAASCKLTPHTVARMLCVYHRGQRRRLWTLGFAMRAGRSHASDSDRWCADCAGVGLLRAHRSSPSASPPLAVDQCDRRGRRRPSLFSGDSPMRRSHRRRSRC